MKKIIAILCTLCFTFISNAQENEDIASLKDDAVKGEVGAQLKLAGYYFLGQGGLEQSYEKAFYWTNKAAEQGNTLAQATIGNSYFTGRGVIQSDEKAFYWAKKSAEGNDETGQFLLAILYFAGKGVAKSNEKGIYWAKKSAEQGFPDAQYLLALCYNEGKGVKKNKQQTIYWLNKACDNLYWISKNSPYNNSSNKACEMLKEIK